MAAMMPSQKKKGPAALQQQQLQARLVLMSEAQRRGLVRHVRFS